MRPAMLLLHGALGAADQLAPLAERLAGAFDVHRLDFEGHGPFAPPARPLAMADFADAVRDHVGDRGLAPVRVFGYSMGGYAALLCARRHPDTVARLMTLGTKLAWTPEVAAREGGFLDAARLRERAPGFAAQLAARHGEPGWTALLDATRAMLHDLGAAPALGPDDWPHIACPVRLAVGDRDATVTLDETAAAFRALPQGELEVVPATPHPLERVDLDRLAASIAAFMA